MKLKKNLVVQKLGERCVIFDNDTSTLHEINNVGFFILKKFKNGKSKKTILDEIIEEYEVDKNTAKKDFEEFLQTLEEMDLIVGVK